MDARFIINNKGEKISVIIPINDYEDFLHRRHLKLELTEEYKNMIDTIFQQEAGQTAEYLNLTDIKMRFSK